MSYSTNALKSAPPEVVSRSAESRSFETFWHGLKQGKKIPSRDDFKPALAVRFLKDLILLESPVGSPELRVRVVGSAIDAQAGKSIVGHDYLDFVPLELHQSVLDTARVMQEQPCGLWQIMPIHYELGNSQEAEVTAFPLAPSQGGIPMIVALVKFPGTPVPAIDIGEQPMVVETATQYEYIDVGAGPPV